MKIEIGKDYDVTFSGSPLLARLHFKPLGAAQYGPFDYLEVGADGILRVPLTMPGPLPGSTTSLTGRFNAAHAFKFKRLMMAGPVSFELEDGHLSIRTQEARIPLEIEVSVPRRRAGPRP